MPAPKIPELPLTIIDQHYVTASTSSPIAYVSPSGQCGEERMAVHHQSGPPDGVVAVQR